MTLAALIAQGGPVMLVLLALSVIATAIVFGKSAELLGLRWRAGDRLARTSTLLSEGDENGAAAQLSKTRHPVARTLEVALRVARDPAVGPAAAQAEVQRAGNAELRRLESWLRGLSAIGHLSPLLGLLGTVLGMIGAFMSLESAGPRVDAALLSGGIWEALLTTAFGLTIAIPSMAAFYVFEGEIDCMRALMRDECAGVLLRHGKLDPFPQDEQSPQREQAFGV